jgi:hypothetical protein
MDVYEPLDRVVDLLYAIPCHGHDVLVASVQVEAW